MNTQKILIFAFYLAVISVMSYSCKEVGCTDPESINYNMEAVEDDGSCEFPSDKLVGDWETTETVTSSFLNETVTFSSKITRIDNKNIRIRSERSDSPEHSLRTNRAIVDWAGKKLTRPNTTVSGTITDENYFEVTYRYDGFYDTYQVKREHRRKK